MPLKDLPVDARPREKLLARGAAALSDAELLALLLRTGIQGKGVLQLADELLQVPRTKAGVPGTGFGGIAGLLHASADDLRSVKGLGPAKRAELLAVLELARRAMAQRLQDRAVFSDPTTVMEYIKLHLAARGHEVFAVMFLDVQNRLLAMEELFRGSLTQLSVTLLRKNFWLVPAFHSHPVREPMKGFLVLATGSKRVVQRIAGLDSFVNFAYAGIAAGRGRHVRGSPAWR